MTDTQVMAALEPTQADRDALHKAGWRVAVHNDYRLNGEDHTFWLFTHPNGRWIKGEGRTDAEALSQCRASSSPAEPVAWAYGPQGDPPTWFASTRWKASDIGKWTETPLYAVPAPPAGDQEKVGRCDIESNLTGCLHPEEHQGRCGYSSPVTGKSDLCEHCGEYVHDCSGHPVAGDAKLRKALEKIATRLSAHPDDTPEDDRRGRHYAYSIATNALATLATPPSVPAQQGWLPIETAPKTGEPVLIWKPDERMVGEYMMVAYWDDDYPAGEPGWVPVGGVHKQGYASSVTGTDQGYPTHWMPLPATPPSQDQKGEEGND